MLKSNHATVNFNYLDFLSDMEQERSNNTTFACKCTNSVAARTNYFTFAM